MVSPSGGWQVKNEELLLSEAPEKNGTYLVEKALSQQAQILSLSLMEKIFIKKFNEDQKINK